MRAFACIAVVAAVVLAAPLAPAADKLSFEDRIELTRGLMAEYANAKVLLPRSKKALEFDATTATFDKKAWTLIAKENGPAARTGDTVQITKIDLEADATTATFDKKAWTLIAKENGPAARTGDTVQITKIDLEADRIVLQLNGGYKGGRH